jgi:hypothetical protein
MPQPSVIARIGGIALKPGISRNRRLYTKAEIAGMVKAAREQIASPDGLPITMLTHHGADDDSTRVVGQVTAVSLDESGNARYRADIAGTPTGRDIATLAEPRPDGRPGFLPGVSIRAARAGARIVRGPDGSPVEAGDELRLVGLDFTHKPGVLGAGIDAFAWTDGGTKTDTSKRVLVTESVEAQVASITEATAPGRPLGEYSTDELASALVGSLATESRSPFWGARSSPGGTQLAESAQEADSDLRKLGDDEFATRFEAAYSGSASGRGYGSSPFWAGAR